VLELIREGLQDHELMEQPAVRAALERGTPDEPRLIDVVDEEDTHYYLVSFRPDGSRNEELARAVIDARYGDLVTIAASEEPRRSTLRTQAQIHRLITNRPIRVPRPVRGVRDRLMADLGELSERPTTEDPAERASRRLDLIEGSLVGVRHPTRIVILRPETTEVSSVLIASAARPYTLLAPSYRVTSGRLSFYVRAFTSAVSRRPLEWFDDPWWLDELTPLGD
jgi:hypothetical protein